jgi:energy-coupling factor transport system permease protein
MSNRFEFLGNATLGQYIPRESWFHNRDPRARLISIFVIFTSIIFTPGLWGLFIGLICVSLIYLLAQLPVQNTWSGIKRALPFILILAILQILFHQTTEGDVVLTEIIGVEITQNAIISAVILIARFLVLIVLLNTFVMSLSTSQVSASIYHLLKPFESIGFPVNDLTMVVQITMRYIPLIAQLAEKTTKAQAARGADWEKRGFNPVKQAKRVIPLIVPLIVNSLRKSETMALAMESRGFYAAHQRSSFYVLALDWEDAALILVSTILSLVIIFSGRIF